MQLTWAFLHYYAMRGDRAAVSYATAFVVLYGTAYQLSLTSAPLTFTCVLVGIYTLSAVLCTIAYRLSPFHPLFKFPGPLLWRTSNLILAYVSFRGKRHIVVDELHKIYGPLLRIGEPKEHQ